MNEDFMSYNSGFVLTSVFRGLTGVHFEAVGVS